ncbi:translocated intimin receptor Tir [Acidipila sp. EB88]|nr:translocated intimin receptor Tir [Acidipila sp. EB88]
MSRTDTFKARLTDVQFWVPALWLVPGVAALVALH